MNELLVMLLVFFFVIACVLFWVRWIDSGAYLKILDKSTFETTATLIDWFGTATTSDAGQTILFTFKSNEISEEIFIRDHLKVSQITQLCIGDTFKILYSPKFKKGIILQKPYLH